MYIKDMHNFDLLSIASLWSWGDGSVGRTLAVQAQRSMFRSAAPLRKMSSHLHIHTSKPPPPSCNSHVVGETTGGLLDLVATSLVPSLARDPISREWGQRMGEQDASVFCCSPCIWTCAPKDMCEHIIYIHTHAHTYTFIKIGKSSKRIPFVEILRRLIVFYSLCC